MFCCSNWNIGLILTDIFKTVRGPNGRFWRMMWVSEALRRRTRIGLQLSRFCFCFHSIFHFEASGMLIGYYPLVVHRSPQCRYGRKNGFSLHLFLHSYHESQRRDKNLASCRGQFQRLGKDNLGKVDAQGSLFQDSLPHLPLLSCVEHRTSGSQLAHSYRDQEPLFFIRSWYWKPPTTRPIRRVVGSKRVNMKVRNHIRFSLNFDYLE